MAEGEAWKESPASSLTAMTHATADGTVAGRIAQWVFGVTVSSSHVATESDIGIVMTLATIGAGAT